MEYTQTSIASDKEIRTTYDWPDSPAGEQAPALMACVDDTGSFELRGDSQRTETVATMPIVVHGMNLARQIEDLTRAGSALAEILRSHESIGTAALMVQLRGMRALVFDDKRQLRFAARDLVTRVGAELGNAWAEAIGNVSSYQAWKALRTFAGDAGPIAELPDRFFTPVLAKYQVHNAATVKAFLVKHPIAVDTLRMAMTHIDNLLAPASKATLDLTIYSDEEGDQELTVLVPTNRDPVSAMKMLGEFDDKWWLDQPDEVRRLITFDMDFR